MSVSTMHYTDTRQLREELIAEIGEGNPVDEFLVDRGHKDGPERHVITDTGIIIVNNQLSGRMVTKLIARPNQIERYYRQQYRKPPERLIRIALRHLDQGYNFY